MIKRTIENILLKPNVKILIEKAYNFGYSIENSSCFISMDINKVFISKLDPFDPNSILSRLAFGIGVHSSQFRTILLLFLNQLLGLIWLKIGLSCISINMLSDFRELWFYFHHVHHHCLLNLLYNNRFSFFSFYRVLIRK